MRSLRQKILYHLINFWPPFWASGIRVKKISKDKTTIDVEMKLRWFNTNYVGVHFGGSLYAMCDPFFMLILMENLGSNYIVWDKAATIRFKRPGKGRVHAKFHIAKEEISKIKSHVDQQGKMEPQFQVHVLDDAGQIIAEVDKVISVRIKDKTYKNTV